MGEVVRIVAEMRYAHEIEAGELFSIASQLEWDEFSKDEEAIGQKVFIRTNSPCPPDQANDIVYRITVIREEVQ
jgi:hypothetical protein